MKTRADKNNRPKGNKCKKASKSFVLPQNRDTMFTGCFRDPDRFIYLLERCRGAATALRKQELELVEFEDLSAEDIEVFGLDSETVYRARVNDVAFLTRDNKFIIIVEHQTKLTPNLAMKLFLYYVELIQLWLEKNGINIHTESKVIEVPMPELYVAYNGPGKIDGYSRGFRVDRPWLKIDTKTDIIDIRYDSLADPDPANPLTGYSYFHKRKEELMVQGMTRDRAFTETRRECMEKGYLKGFIEREEFLVYKRIFDYDEQLRSEGVAIGEAIGEARGVAIGEAKKAEQMLCAAIASKCPQYVLEGMADVAGVSRERLQEMINTVSK